MSSEAHIAGTPPAEHDHDGGPAWWKIMDVLVWVAIAMIVILGTEWLVGLLIREKLAAGFDKIRRVRSTAESAE